VRLTILTIVAVAAMAASVLYASHVQRATAERHAVEAGLAESVLADVNRVDAAAGSFALTGRDEVVDDFEAAEARLLRNLAVAAEASDDDRGETAAVRGQRTVATQLTARVQRDLTSSRARSALRDDAAVRHALVDRFTTANNALRRRQAVLAQGEDRRASLVPPLLIVILSLLFGAGAAVAVRRSLRVGQRLVRERASQGRFAEAMQVSESQAEAHALLRSHLERTIDGASVTVLHRNNSADRLETSTPLPDDSALGQAVRRARPRSCMAIRLSRRFTLGAGSEEVLACGVCGVLAADTTCQPLLVGGEVIGAVLTEHRGSLAESESERIAQSVAQSAPVLANLRNLAIAETRAATDALTGLPNRRAVDETLLRMLAQAARSLRPLSVVLLDLDHFKKINDTYGHDRGDEVLAAFATRLREVMRASDFAGRSGGEEFVLFLPDTDRAGAVRLAEKLRATMRGLTVPGVERAITASFGIACYPDDAIDAATVMRTADRALYAAKNAGRDRIEASCTGSPPAAPPPAAENGTSASTGAATGA
jgi:diguanylate cyclase (GGDEF)-like protein